jgi:hypothetical protein
VTFYAPNTTTLKTVWADAGATLVLTNPVLLDAAGRPQTGTGETSIYGTGSYTMMVQDQYGNTVIGPVLTQDYVSLITGILTQGNYASFAQAPVPVPGDILQIGPNNTLVDTGLPVSTLIRQVLNVAAVRALTIASCPQDNIYMLGYFTQGDRGEGLLVVNFSDTTSVDNGGTIFIDASGRRWYRMGTEGIFQLEWFGGTTQSADVSGAFGAALRSMKSPGGIIQMGPGTFNFASAVGFAWPAGQFSLTLLGAGADVTVLEWSTSSGFAFTASSPAHSVHVRDLTLATAAAGGNFTAISCINSVQGGSFAQNDFTRVTVRGSDGGGAANFWTNGIFIQGWNNFNYFGCLLYGNAIANGPTLVFLEGNQSGSFKYSLVHNFIACGFYNHGIGVVYGGYVQGVAFESCNFTNGTTDILTPAGTTGQAQLSLNNCQMAGLGNRILLQGPIAALNMTGNLLFISANTVGVSILATLGEAAFSGNTFSGLGAVSVPTPGTVGIYDLAGAFANVCTGNTFYGVDTGVNLQGAPAGWNIALNSYYLVTTPVANVQGNSVGVITP